ncbi:MAG: YidC/Oxa1 family membrane protein insertase [Clostridia bacterium]|nr:YidC/Oxa1 family membrane protein insertase [Clostridia bacterium]
MFEYCITRPMGWIIEQIYNLVANYGLSIIIFTILIKLILLPLNIRSQKAMKKQQKIQPILQELQTKYANDKEKLQREMAKLYKENDVSLTGGCLPMLIQFPILIGLYRVIYAPLKYLLGVDVTSQSAIDRVAQLKDAMVQAGHSIGNLAQLDAAGILKNSQIQVSQWAQTLNGAMDEWAINFNFCGLDISNVPSVAMNYIMRADFSDWGKIALLLIPALAVITSILSNKITMAQSGQKNTNPNADDSAAQMSRTMTMMMPVMTGVFTFTLPAGLGVYWIISSVMQIVQQLILNAYFNKKGDDIDVRIPEKKQLHGKKSKKRK